MKTNPPFAVQLDHINSICAAAIASLHKEPVVTSPTFSDRSPSDSRDRNEPPHEALDVRDQAQVFPATN